MSPSDLPLVGGILFRTAKVMLMQNRVGVPDLVKAFDVGAKATRLSSGVPSAAMSSNAVPSKSVTLTSDAGKGKDLKSDGMARLAHVRWLTDGVLHAFFGGAYCTKRTMILFHYARRYGVEATVNFGVARQKETIKGHAWITIDGEPYMENDGTVDDFKIIYSYPPSET